MPVNIVYGAKWCSFCTEAKDLLERKGVDFQYKDIDISPKDFWDLDKETVPQIFIEGKHIGGYQDLVEYFA